ncbi:hypothetical protein Btru_041823 [Bulinus truncatus]|nr:hypothetical protein Btru_041823 [Bulinus truncatus]
MLILNRSEFKCHRGQYMYYSSLGLPACIDCEPGTFEPEDNHENYDCRPCSRVNGLNHQVVLKECTAISDTVIGCREGFYEVRDGVHQDDVDLDCNICTTCTVSRRVEIRKCTNTSDAVCCSRPGTALSLGGKWAAASCNETYPVNEANFVCQRGQYIDFTDPGVPRCLDCPEGTYSDKDNHRDVNCSPCTRPVYLDHELVRTNCSRVSDTVIGCKRGYYRIVRHFLSFQDVDCLKCRNCESEQMLTIRSCSETHDSICCDRWGSNISETSEHNGRCQD